MTEYLTPEQRMALENQLAGGEEMLTGRQARAAMQEGMRMAQSDMAAADLEEREEMADGGEAEVFVLDEADRAFCREHGYRSMRDIRWGFGLLREVIDRQRELLYDMEQAELTAAELDVRHPEYAARRRVEIELRPMREEANRRNRNRMIQQEWLASAAEMRDIERMLPDMAGYIMEHPRFSEDPEGLTRAYEAVRSRKYRGEDELLKDPEFIGRMAGDERVKEAVLRAHLEEILRGGLIPQGIGATQESGKTPLSAKKPITGMEQAKKRLEAMLTR